MIELIYITLITIVASAVGVLSGFGLGTIMTPTLILFLPFQQAIFIIAIIHWFHDIWKIWLFDRRISWRLFLYFGVPGVVGSFFGSLFALYEPVPMLTHLFGGFLVSYSFFLFVNPDFKIERNGGISVFGGLLSGFTAGVFGMRGALRSIFLSAYNLPRAVYLSTIGAISLVMDTVRVGTYWAGGIVIPSTIAWGLFLFVPASFLGSFVAKFFVDRVPKGYYRYMIAAFLFILGIRLLIFPINNFTS